MLDQHGPLRRSAVLRSTREEDTHVHCGIGSCGVPRPSLVLMSPIPSANAALMSPSHFSRQFRAAYGETPAKRVDAGSA